MTDTARDKRLFDTLRAIMGRGLTQGEVDRVNAALYADIVSRPVREASQAAYDIIMKWEGFRSEAYPDPGTGGKPWTIGYGSTTDENGAPIQPGTKWTKLRAQARLVADVSAFERGVQMLIGDAPTTQGQFDAMVSFAYNVGLDIDDDTKAEGLGDSTLLKKHLDGDHAGAAHEFGKWINAGGRRLNGLVARRAEEAELYAS